MEPVTAAIGGIAWLLTTVLASGPDGSGSAGFVLNAVIGGILGNEAHRLYRERAPLAIQHLRGLSLPENHDLARAVRTAQTDALRILVTDYKTSHEAAWRAAPTTRPALFLDRMFVVCNDMRAACAAGTFVFDTAVSETLRVTFEGLLSEAVPGAPASLRAAALAGFTEDAVLLELSAALADIAIPADFEALFRHGAEGRPRFLDLFGAFFSKQITTSTSVHAIMTAKFLARIEGLAFDATEIMFRIETRFGQKLDAIQRHLEHISDAAARRHAEMTDGQRRLERLVIDAAGSGAASVQAIVDIRDLLRPGIPDIDSIPAERLPALVRRLLEQLRQPTAIDVDFSGAVKHALAEAQARVDELAFSDAAHVLDAQIPQIEAKKRDLDRDLAALLAERGRVASLQLRYRDAAGFYRRAADAVAFDPSAAWSHALAAADALYDQGSEFGENEALRQAIAAYGEALRFVLRERAPLDWAKTQNDLGTALTSLGARESGTARLEESVEAYRAALLELTRDRVPLYWAMTQNNLGTALARLGERKGDPARLAEAVEAYRAALLEWTRDRVPLDWAMTQNNLGAALARLGARESGTARLAEAVEVWEACIAVTATVWPAEWIAHVRSSRDAALAELARRSAG